MTKFGFDARSSMLEDAAFRPLLDEVEAFIYTTDLDGRYTYANRKVLELLGQSLDAIVGRDIGEFFDLSRDDSLRRNDERVLRHGETIAREETNRIQATGEVRSYWSVKKPLRDAAGTISGMLGISYETTERRRLEDKVREQNRLLDAVLDNIDALVYMKDASRRFLYANRRAADAFGRPVEEVVGNLDSNLMPRAAADRFWAQDQQIFQSGERYAGEQTLEDAHGVARHYWSVIVPWSRPDGTPAIIGFSTDITELHDLKEDLQRQAVTDMLTGVANRRGFYAHAQQAFARCRERGVPLGLISIDIDHFKRINDRFGHLAGDQVLHDFAACCQGALRKEDLCARTGGEEFCIILPGVDLDAAFALAERLRALVAERRVGDVTAGTSITASFGVTGMLAGDADFERLLRRVDRALYQAKQAGRNRTCMVVRDD
jgi:diguanylate cyclase (GGDEF)-like protein/PAS domain S-box-containing protein